MSELFPDGAPGDQGPAKERDVTPEPLYLKRRELLRTAALFGATAAGVGGVLSLLTPSPGGVRRARKEPGTPDGGTAADPGLLTVARSQDLSGGEEKTSLEDCTHWNNFYELGTDKTDPARNADTLKPRPWTVTVEGEVARAQTLDIDTLIRWFPLEERIYRMRCVEAWSMVMPWVGIPLGDFIRRLEPTSRAKYVAFTTLMDPVQLPGESRHILDWPYVEGLRIDEAVHPLALLAVGLYGRVLPGQNGAPLRLVVPWKYGFKGIKSITRIRFTEEQPPCTWNLAAPSEYGFYANVNPAVDHPRWSQAMEHRIGEFGRRATLPFNGYADQVAHLYAGLDLRANY